MNIDQAIYILRNTAWLGSNDERDETEQAVEMVIDKLLSAEKAQLSGEDTTKDATYDSISRKDAIDAVEFGITYAKAIDVNTGESKELFKEGNDALKKAVERLKELPSAEPEIIRCNDCKHHILHPRMGVPWCRLLHSDMGDNQFCSYAERRGEEE